MASERSRPYADRDALLLFAIVLLALGLRLFGLGREGLWYDEAFTLRFARQTFGGLYALLVREAWDPPVYPTVVWIWTRLVGAGDWQARLVSALCGTSAVLVLHGLARELFDRRTADVAALLAAVSPFLVAYSQEARSYALLLALLLLMLVRFVAALPWRAEGSARKAWIQFVVLAAVATLTHYYALFALLSLAIFLALFRRSFPVPGRRILGGILLFGAILAPWLASGVLSAAASQPIAQLEFTAPWFSVDARTFLRTMNDFHGGRLEGMLAPAPRWTHPVGAVLFAVPALLALRPLASRAAAPGERASLALLALLWLVPMACLIALGFARVQFATRYVLFCVAPYLVLAARGLVSLRPALRAPFLGAIVAWSAFSLHALYTIPHKEDWRGALDELAREVRPGDGVLFLPFGETPYEWPVYHPDGPELDVVGPDEVATAACERLWVLTYHRVAVDDPLADRARVVVAERRIRVRESDYFLVRLELWE